MAMNRSWSVMVVVVWVVASLVVCVTGIKAKIADYSFGVAIDAGSSGSRISVYKWIKRDFETLPPSLSVPILQHIIPSTINPKVKPGINSASGRDKLRALVTEVAGTLESQDIKVADTPILLKATAGLRILNITAREEALDQTRAILAASPFKFEDKYARVISGEEEGVFGWVTCNYLKGSLLESGNPGKTVGALDMGGASTQITYEPNHEVLANLFNLQLESVVNTNLYTHSFLYYGLDQFRHRLNLAVAAGRLGTVNNPCYNTNAKVTFNASLSFVGTGDADACRAVVRTLLYRNAVCLTDPGAPSQSPLTCSMNGVYQPPLDGKFYAFSGYSYLWGFLGLAPDVTLETVDAAVTSMCATNITELAHLHPKEDPDYLVNYCHSGSYLPILLTEGYGFDPKRNDQLYVVPESNTTYSYALGGMIFDANAMEWRYTGKRITTGEDYKRGFIIALVACGVMLLALGYFVMSRRSKSQVTADAIRRASSSRRTPLLEPIKPPSGDLP